MTHSDIQTLTHTLELIQKTMATKDDITSFATKEDLAELAKKDDLKNFVTHDYLDQKLEKQFTLFTEALGSWSEHLETTLGGRMDKLEQYMETRFNRLELKVDKLHTEIKTHRMIFGEHESRIQTLERNSLSGYLVQDNAK